jgi:hypothetical protein
MKADNGNQVRAGLEGCYPNHLVAALQDTHYAKMSTTSIRLGLVDYWLKAIP